MSRYKNPAIREMKDQQVDSAPRETRLDQIDRAERLIHDLDPDQNYRYAELHRRITSEQSLSHPDLLISGREALHDVRQLVEDLSDSTDVSVESAGEPVLTIAEVSRRFNVSTKTVDRWRDRGLVSRRYRFGSRKRIGFLESSLARFVKDHAETIERGGRFTHLSVAEQGELIRRARSLAAVGASLPQVIERLVKKLGRSPETVRYSIKQHDREHPEQAIFPFAAAPLTEEAKREMFARFREGMTIERLSHRYSRSKTSVERILKQQRAEALCELNLEFIDNDEFRRPGAEATILAPEPPAPLRKGRLRAPAGIPAYLASLYEVPLLSPEQEVYFFRKMNYLKFRGWELRERLDAKRPKSRDMDRIDEFLREAEKVKNLLIRRNLRLVVSVAKKYVRPGSNFFEMVSDGNISLIRAVEKFDYGRGFKLSTYATWAITKNFARTIPAEQTQRDRFRTGTETLFHDCYHEGTSLYEQEQSNRSQRELIAGILDRLDDRERAILVTRYGLAQGSEPKTLKAVGEQFGVTKERIRQLEARALGKLREIAEEEKLDIPGVR